MWRLWLTMRLNALCVRDWAPLPIWSKGEPSFFTIFNVKIWQKGENVGIPVNQSWKKRIWDSKKSQSRIEMIATFLGARPSWAVLLRLEELSCLFFFPAAFATICWNLSAHVLSLHIIFFYLSDYIFFLRKCTSTHGKSRYVIGMGLWVSQSWRGKQRYFFSLFD